MKNFVIFQIKIVCMFENNLNFAQNADLLFKNNKLGNI